MKKAAERDTATESLRKSSWAKELGELTSQKNSAIDRRGALETNIENYKQIISYNEKSAKTNDEEHERYKDLELK